VIFSAFFYGYTSTQILGGLLSGKYGAKIVLGMGAFIWSIFTFLTPAASPLFWSLIACRVLLGLGEGVGMPSVHNFAGLWLPPQERSLGVTLISSGQYFGTFLALVASPQIAIYFGWEYIFYIFGVIGLIWLVAFYFKATSSPQNHSTISQEEKKFIADALKTTDSEENIPFSQIPWRKFATKMPFYAIIVAHFCHNYGWYIMISWMPKYFESLGVQLSNVGWYSVLPYLGMSICSNLGGFLATTLQKKRVYTLNNSKDSSKWRVLHSCLFFPHSYLLLWKVSWTYLYDLCNVWGFSVSKRFLGEYD